MTVSQLHNTIKSQFKIARLNYPLWSFRHLLGGLNLSHKWFIRSDGTAPPPLAMAWYITHSCPEKCDFCNVSRALEEETPELSFERSCQLIDTLIPQIPVVALGGGEPMVYPKIIELIERIHARQGRVFLVTSGTAMGTNKAKALCDAHPEMIMLSLLGDATAHDKRMGRLGAYQRTLNTIEQIQKYRTPKKTRLILNCTISPSEAHILPKVIKIAKDSKVDALRFSWLSFMSPKEAQQTPMAEPYFILPKSDISSFNPDELWQQVQSIKKNHSNFVQFLPRLSKKDFYAWFTGAGVDRACLSLWHTLFVRPDGSVVPCGHMQNQLMGNVLKSPLQSYWNSPTFKQLRLTQRSTPFQMCRRCCKI